MVLIVGAAEEDVGPIEGDGAATDDEACGDGAPENVRAGKLPDCEQRRDHGDQDASARYPERDTSDEARIQITAS